jgi:hypothetical protein
MDIINKTSKPLSIPLPAGKKLFLGPGKTGQITQKAFERPAVVALLEAGSIESVDGSFKPKGPGGVSGGGNASGRQGGAGGAMRQSGDR